MLFARDRPRAIGSWQSSENSVVRPPRCVLGCTKEVHVRLGTFVLRTCVQVAEQYLDNFGAIAKAGTTMLLPAATHDPASMVAR